MNTVSTTGLYRMPAHDDQRHRTYRHEPERRVDPVDDQRRHQTHRPSTRSSWPGLPRATAEAEVHGVNAMFNFTSRPESLLRPAHALPLQRPPQSTPEFDAVEYVRFDAVPGDGRRTENFNVRQNTFDLTGTLNLISHSHQRQFTPTTGSPGRDVPSAT